MAGVLYKKEREVLEYLAQFQRQYGYSPTLGEIAKATGHRSNATIHAIIRSLVDKGYVQKVEGNARVLKIIDQKFASTMTGVQPSIEVPLMGYIEAGKTLEPHADQNATVQISASFISGKRTAFALEVKGGGFVSERVQQGDLLIVEKVPEVEDGAVVVAMIEDTGVTIKRYAKEDGKIMLKPIHAMVEPIYPENLTIIGRVAGLVRRF